MITPIQGAEALQTCIVVILAATVVFKILPMYRLDCFRQKMFQVRDELFDYAADGNIAFDDPAYILLRVQMNAMIRYGHQITLFRALVTSGIRWVSGNEHSLPWYDSWEKSLANLKNDEVRRKMAEFHERSNTVAAKHLIGGSVVLWAALAIAAMVLFLGGAAWGARQLLKAAARKVLSGPIDQRLIEEDAVCSKA
jgi:hypothetical protein